MADKTAQEVVNDAREAIENDKPATPAKPAPPPFTPKVVARVTMPLLKFVENVPIYVRLTGTIFKGKETKGTQGGVKMEPADLCHAVDLTTKKECQIIVATVLRTHLEESYPNGGYKGKCFQLTKFPRQGTRRYSEYEILEIADPYK